MNIELVCNFCEEVLEKEIDVGGWSNRYESINDDDCFCPKHKGVGKFLDAVCTGCVSSWGECEFWQSIRNEETLLGDMEIIISGRCPKRCNGTFSMSKNSGIVGHINISDKADEEACRSMIKAIKDYLKDKDSERQGIAITSIFLGIVIVIPFISVVGILLALLSLKIKKNKKLSKVALIINLIALLPWLAVVIFGV